jgi:tetratricopeptide (TPR) repeat protein
MSGQFTNFEKDGQWTWWDEKGRITTSKKYVNGLLSVEKDNLDSYIEKMEYFLSQRNYKEALKNVELAEGTITDKSEANPIYMGLAVYRSKCHSYFSHYQQGEKVLLDVIGLSESQAEVIQNCHLEKSEKKIKNVIAEISKKDQLKFTISNHIALALCYNILQDTIQLQIEQQQMMDKGQKKDWIVTMSLELYKLLGERFNNYATLEDIQNRIEKEGLDEKLELYKAEYLMKTEKFQEAEIIADKYLERNDKNLSALLLKADLEMAYGNVGKMKIGLLLLTLMYFQSQLPEIDLIYDLQ